MESRASDLDRAADLIDQMASAEPVAWIKYLEGAAVKPTGECYDMVFVPVHGYEPLFRAPQPAPIPAEWRDAVVGLVDDIDGLIGESTGVYGLHLNGNPSPWDELTEGGRFERLTHLEQVRSMIAAAPQPSDHSEQPLDMVANGIRSEKCPNGLTPDGPICPRCGKRRGPSGVDGGSWVHY